jgi:hypothetical protein
MPFSSLTDPTELARAGGALDVAWNEVRYLLPDPFDERERTRLAYIVASLVSVADDEDDLVRRVVERFREKI